MAGRKFDACAPSKPNKAVNRKGRKFDQVVEGARQVFMSDGFDGASVDDIAKAAGVSKATLYAYFPDKKLLFLEVAKTECKRQAEACFDVLQEGATLRDVLLSGAQHMIRFFISDFAQGVFRLCVAESERFPEFGRDFYTSGPMMARNRLLEAFRAANDSGAMQIDDLQLASDQFVELCKTDIWPRLIFGISREFSEEEIARVATGAVDVIFARYGV
ncbi:TetR/AcrR family transcriptional regulator [Litorivita pollutaquae]|uniref:TetR/AcrR family transcriptional regulator n=2 Tax=Litorivita pollutaquae TaxID=2200892 RepID=A0A2V4MKC7_9RHOB|nr:TetR family transcriptional regulator [Rhodobacterales bacterium 59_46_T64]PYC47091.1 TetR/AcrR family transcriptional regulator [Litorivita pollutaquae]